MPRLTQTPSRRNPQRVQTKPGQAGRAGQTRRPQSNEAFDDHPGEHPSCLCIFDRSAGENSERNSTQ